MDYELIAMASPTGVVLAVVVEYLDLDGDGVPDAVRIRPARPDEVDEDDEPDAASGDVQVMALR